MEMIAKAVKPKIDLRLNDPGMTMLHCAGVDGLYITLKALAKRYPTLKSRQGNFKWVLSNTSISLYWKGNDYAALDWLFKESFQISSDGLISLTGLNLQSWEAQLATHIGIKNTFLQHNSFFKSAGDAYISLNIDGLEVLVDYKKAKFYAHQNFAEKLCDENGQLSEQPIGIKGWLYPGATVKHYAFEKQTQFTETIERALALLFAPVACLYFIVPKSYLHVQKARYCLVIPDITDLKLYARQRQKFNNSDYKYFNTSGYTDAGLRFLVHETALNIAQHNNFKRCQVITFGKTQWSNVQKVRQRVKIIEATDKIIGNYQFCDRYFPERLVEGGDGNFIASSIVRELITENLARGFPWWHNFTLAVRNKDLFRFVGYEREGLQKMVKNIDWDTEAHELFIQVCHEALSRIYAKLYSQAKENDYVQIERENERLRSSLLRCQNHKAFRHFMASFLTKAGSNSIYINHEKKLTPLITYPKNWELSRDLALLALVSYKTKKQKDNENELTSALVTQKLSEE